MTFDAPRKTLDDIRRELDAEYSSCVTPPTTPGDVTVLTTTIADVIEAAAPKQIRDAKRAGRARRFGYIVAALIGCLVGQGALLGFFLIVRPTIADVTTAPPTIATPAAMFEASPGPDVAAASPAVAPFVPPVALPAPVAAERPAFGRVVSRSDAIGSTKPPQGVKPPEAVKPPETLKPPEAGRAPDAPLSVTESEGEVRAALSQWLTTSNVGDGSIAEDTAVFLRADGNAARTYVPTKSGDEVIIREQRWQRGPNGWSIIEDREAWRPR